MNNKYKVYKWVVGDDKKVQESEYCEATHIGNGEVFVSDKPLAPLVLGTTIVFKIFGSVRKVDNVWEVWQKEGQGTEKAEYCNLIEFVRE